MADPIQAWSRVIRSTAAVSIAALVALGWYAFGPLTTIDQTVGGDARAVVEPDVDPQPEEAVLSAETFDVQFWNPPPPQVLATTEQQIKAPSKRPLQLELLAIRDHDGTFTAVVYDTRNDAILELTVRTTVQSFDVVAISAKTVRLAHDDDVRELQLTRPSDDVIEALRDVATFREGDA